MLYREIHFALFYRTLGRKGGWKGGAHVAEALKRSVVVDIRWLGELGV